MDFIEEGAPIPSLCAVPSGSENHIELTNGLSDANPYCINASVIHLCWAVSGCPSSGISPISCTTVSLKSSGKIKSGLMMAPPLTVWFCIIACPVEPELNTIIRSF